MKPPVCWSDRAGEFENVPLAIVSTGPSFDEFDVGLLRGWHVFALNAAITEVCHHRSVFWVCHDLHKIWRHNLRERIRSYKNRQLITRRVNLPGKFGDIPYRAVGGGTVKKRFNAPMPESTLKQFQVFWYSELDGQHGFLLATETVLEIALEVATLWGFSPILLVGVDMGPVNGNAYASKWRWKPCKIKPHKFEAMRRVMVQHRARWPEEVFTLSKHWKGAFHPTDLSTVQRFTSSIAAERKSSLHPNQCIKIEM